MSSSQPTDPWLGRSLGDRQRYLLKKRIGSGGMGDVYLATDTLLGQPVALKLLNNRVASDELRTRFEREVAVCAALRSDHIVQVSDYGVTPDGYPFFVMEYLQGKTLGQLFLREKQFTVERTVSIVTQICAGLHPAHQGIFMRRSSTNTAEYVKVIHRDLKPDNIFLVPTALGEFVKILDFGIAKIRSDQAHQTNLTHMFLGTYQYAAPEQINNEKTLDERADIYSLGMILYGMLSGAEPFRLGHRQAEEQNPSGVGWAVAHLTKTPIPLRQQPGCEALPEALEAIVMRCLEKAPAQRFPSVAELSQALQDAVSNGKTTEKIAAKISEEETVDDPPATLSTVQAAQPVKLRSQETQNFSNLQTVAYSQTRFPNRSGVRRPTRLLIAGGVLAAVLGGVGVLYLLRSPTSLPFFRSQPSVSPEPSPGEENSPLPSSASISTQSLSGHSDAVWAVAISPDGQTIASGGYDKTIRLWDTQTGQMRRVLSAHADAVRAIAISADGKILASSSGDKTIKIWNLQTGELLYTLYGHTGPVWTIALSPDSKTLASGSYDGTIKIWDIQAGKELRTLPDHYDSVWSVAISPNGKILASASYDGTIKIWDFQTGQSLHSLEGHSDVVRSVAISPDSKILASASWDKTVKVWDLATGNLLHTLTGHTDRVLSVAISPDGKTLASSSIDRTIKLWDLATGNLLRTLTGHSDWVVAVAFSPNGKTLISGSKDKSVKIWQLQLN